MSQGRHGIKVLGLSLLAALGLMAFTATVAQAGEFTIEGSSFTSKGISSETAAGTIAAGKLLVPGLSLTFTCTGGTSSATFLLGGVVHGTTLLSGCAVEGNKFCKIYETKAKMETELEADRGFIVASGLGELILMGGKHYLLTSSGAGAFGTIYVTKAAKGCTLSLEESITGSTVDEILNALTPLTQQTLRPLSQAAIESLFPSDSLKYGNQSAWADEGDKITNITGVNNGKKWGAE